MTFSKTMSKRTKIISFIKLPLISLYISICNVENGLETPILNFLIFLRSINESIITNLKNCESVKAFFVYYYTRGHKIEKFPVWNV
jgi:hypothetical protein